MSTVQTLNTAPAFSTARTHEARQDEDSKESEDYHDAHRTLEQRPDGEGLLLLRVIKGVTNREMESWADRDGKKTMWR